MAADLKLYQSNSSPNSRRVRIFLAIKGIQIEIVPVDLGSKEQFSEAYGKINPRRVVPTLVLPDGTSIGEVPAIQLYLEAIDPATPLLGSTPKEKAQVAMWDRRMEAEGFAVVMETVRNNVAGLAGRAIAGPHAYDQIPALVERGRIRLADFYSDLEARLNQTPFVAGDDFTVADITAAVAIDFATAVLKLGIPDENAATKRWYESVSSLEGFDA